MIQVQPTVEFGKRRDQKRTKGVSQNIDGHHERAQFYVGRFELAHDTGYARSEHGGCKRTAMKLSAEMSAWRSTRNERYKGDAGDDGNVTPLDFGRPIHRICRIVRSIPEDDVAIC